MEAHERRKYIRLEYPFLVKYKPHVGTVPENDLSMTKNISAGGILFEVKEKLNMSEVLDLVIDIPSSDKLIEATGKVVRIEELDSMGRYDVGMEFIEIAKEDMEWLEKHVEFLS